eukprot:365761-Chlamydomonas_euryale.AAC.6
MAAASELKFQLRPSGTPRVRTCSSATLGPPQRPHEPAFGGCACGHNSGSAAAAAAHAAASVTEGCAAGAAARSSALKPWPGASGRQ